MGNRHVVIVGGGLAGLSAGCYALRSGFDATIVEHNLRLGGVCTAWERGRFVVDGCIQWLTGGAFLKLYLYDELGISRRVPLRTLDTWQTYLDVRDGLTIPFHRNLDGVIAELSRLSREDTAELARVRQGASVMPSLPFPIDAQEQLPIGERVRFFGELLGLTGTLVHFRKPVGSWAVEHLVSPRLRRIFTTLFEPTIPALFMLMVLGYLERGYLSRPVGGTAAFRDALVAAYGELGGRTRLYATVDEIVVRDGRARGVRLTDGTLIEADVVISTSSVPETVLRLLGGRYDAGATWRRLERWKLVDPIVLASFGVEQPYSEKPQLLAIDGLAPFSIGGRANESVYVRVQNDDPALAPPGHSVIQAWARTDYEWWATRSARYQAERDAAGETLLSSVERGFPGVRAALRMRDIATPLTYWNETRSWLGAYEGWIPQGEGLTVRIPKRLPGLSGFYMAGQWVEPGGGVPIALMSGRQAVQLLCADENRAFVAAEPRREPAAMGA